MAEIFHLDLSDKVEFVGEARFQTLCYAVACVALKRMQEDQRPAGYPKRQAQVIQMAAAFWLIEILMNALESGHLSNDEVLRHSEGRNLVIDVIDSINGIHMETRLRFRSGKTFISCIRFSALMDGAELYPLLEEPKLISLCPYAIAA